ncbi:MAG: glycerophosphodiester phosphodiesterase, partial [Steroidobacteraceae bacterium]
MTVPPASPPATSHGPAPAPAAPLPIVIAHRGASGYRPEHTLESYRLAIEMGADFIEPDLVATRDGALVARHEPEIGEPTDVAAHPRFAARRTTYVIDGREVTGWFTIDFTLAELRTLRAVQPRPYRSKEFDGQFAVPTLEQIIELAQRESRARGRAIGIYPETKHPSWHCEQGVPLEPPLLAALGRAGWTRREDPVFLQSFEAGNLRWLRERTGLRLIQLLDAGGLAADGRPLPAPRWIARGGCALYDAPSVPQDFDDPASFAAIARYADGVGPWKRWLVGARATRGDDPTEATRQLVAPSRFVEHAHGAGLLVHPWTFRNEPQHLAADYGGDPLAEYAQFFALGVDGVFSDFSDTAVAGG